MKEWIGKMLLAGWKAKYSAKVVLWYFFYFSMPESPSPTFGVEVCSAWRQELEEVLLTLGFPVSQMVKHLSAMWETRVWSLDQEESLEKGMATHSSILAWRLLWIEEAGRLYSPWGCKESDTTEQLTHTLLTLNKQNHTLDQGKLGSRKLAKGQSDLNKNH